MVIGTMNNPSAVLLTIADMSVIEAEVEVDETDIPNVQLGQTAKVTIDAMPGQDVHRQGHRDRQQPDPDRRAGGRRAGDQLQGGRHARRADPRGAARLHLHGRHHDRDARERGRGADPGDDRARAGLRREGQRGEAARRPTSKRRAARGRAGGRGGGAEAGPDARRKPRACSSVGDGQRREFVPVKTGIAGDKYFEVLDGLKDGDQVITGPFASVRDAGRRHEGEGRRRRKAPRRRPRSRRAMTQSLESVQIALARDLGQQAPVVPDGARQHRRRDVDHRRGVAHPGHERVGHDAIVSEVGADSFSDPARGHHHERGGGGAGRGTTRASRWRTRRRSGGRTSLVAHVMATAYGSRAGHATAST